MSKRMSYLKSIIHQFRSNMSLLFSEFFQVSDFFSKLIQRVAPKSYQQAYAEVYVTQKFLENFCGDQVFTNTFFLFPLKIIRECNFCSLN